MLRPTFMSFETARSALVASQLGLDTVGQNISNADTVGYTRQRVDKVSLSSGGYGSKYQIRGGMNQLAGQGAKITGISQIRDPYLDTRYRNEAATYGEQAVKLNTLKDLENILDEVSANGLGAKLQELLTELSKFEDSADSVEVAAAVRAIYVQFASMLNKKASELNEAMDNAKYDLDAALNTSVNLVLEQIAYLNTKIREDQVYGNPSNELMDARNLLIDQLSEFLPIKVVNTPEKISDDLTISNLSIVLVDNSTIPAGEYTLVDTASYYELSAEEDSDGFVQVSLNQGNKKIDLTNSLTKGAIRGYVDMINGIGDFAGNGHNAFRGIAYYQKSLDVFANQFASTMNSLNRISVADAAGKQYVGVYDPKDLFTAADGSGIITAANICITKLWQEDPFYLTTSKEDPSDPVPVLDDKGNPVLDDKSNPVYETPINNDNILAMINALKGTAYFRGENTDNRTFTLFSGSFEEFIGNYQEELGLDKNLADTMLSGSATVIAGYADSRDAVSAVSIDEEAINMMTYQNYYNAAARYMTVIDEALGTIIQGMGVVGR